MPDPADVSVVVQGPVGEWTDQVLESVAQHLPGAQVVLSTWAGSTLPASAGTVDVVLSDDPGAGPVARDGAGNEVMTLNTSRMLTSTRAGLQRAERPYVLKLRTDSPLVSDDVLGWDAARAAGPDCLFTERIAVPSIATRSPHRSSAVLHHPSDCAHFGRAEDVVALWGDAPFDQDVNVGWWARRGAVPPLGVDVRLFNEQVVWLSHLERRGVVDDYPHAGATVSTAMSDRALALLCSNFVVLELWQFGLRLPKLEGPVAASSLDSYFWYEEWLAARQGSSL